MDMYVVDAFADEVFQGNPAAVCLMDRWPEDGLLYKITRENAVHESAFCVPAGEDLWDLRWLTAREEINLCGHATLATAYILFRFVCPEAEEVKFRIMGGEVLSVRKQGELLEMDFPAYVTKPMEVTDLMEQVIGVRPIEAFRARDLVCVVDDPEFVVNMQPDLELAKQLRGALLHVTAKGENFDCVSRTFGPKINNPEDPVCGSGHCHFIPYWAEKLGKRELVARQASPRGGTLYCRVENDRVLMAGRAVLYSRCKLYIPGLS